MIGEAPICMKCKWFDDSALLNKQKMKCSAFDSIPEEILNGENNHSEPLDNQDNDIVFEPKE